MWLLDELVRRLESGDKDTYMVGGVLRLSTIDFPGLPSAVIYCKGCDMRCPYCHNASLARGDCVGMPVTHAAKVAERRGLEGVVITGGEPMLDSRVALLINLLHRIEGMKVKLDTNGVTMRLVDLASSAGADADESPRCLPDYVALDIKLPTEARYREWGPNLSIGFWSKLISNIRWVNGNKDGEFRTTVHKSILSMDDLRTIGKGLLLGRQRPWYLQQFRKCKCPDMRLNDEPTYSDEELADMAIELGAYVRGVDQDTEERVRFAVEQKAQRHE